jgi:hypothetical protein
MQIIVEAMLATVQEEFHIADAQVETFYAKFMSKLPESMQPQGSFLGASSY